MVAGRPFYHAYPADFFTATQGWDVEMKGPYRLIIDLLNERDRPIPDEAKFMAGILGCSPQRWKKIRDFLLDHGKLIYTPDGLHLTNPRFEREHADRLERRTESQMHGRAGGLASAARRAGQTELDLASSRTRTRARHTRTESPKNRDKVATKLGKTSKTSASHSNNHGKKARTFNGSDQPPPQAPCARDSSESIDRDSSQPIYDSTPRDSAGLANASLKTLYDAVCDAAGVCFTQPDAIDRAMTQVEDWQQGGMNFDEVVIPTIRSVVLSTDEPTRVLARFNRDVMHEHAKRKAAAAKGEHYEPPEIPRLNPDGEDPEFLPLRTDLLEALGPALYCMLLNRVTLSDAGECQGDRHPLRVQGLDHYVEHVRHGRNTSVILAVAKRHGFTDLW